MTWNIVLFDGFANQCLRNTVRVDVSCVPGVKTAVVGTFEDFVDFGRVVQNPRLPIFMA